MLFIGGAAIYNAIAKSKAAGTLNFYPASVQDISFQGTTPYMKIGLAVQNTSSENFVIKSIAGNLYSNNYLIGNLSYFQPQAILPNSQSMMYLSVRLALLGIVNDVIQAFENNNTTQNLLFKGFANVDNFNVPINIPYKVGL